MNICLLKKIVLSGFALLPLIGCAQPGQRGYAPAGTVGMNKTTGGAVSSAAATGPGVVLSGIAGGSVGASVDSADRAMLARQTQSALEYSPSGQPVQWQNPENGHYGNIVSQAAYQRGGSYCRGYQQTVIVGGRMQQAYGTACRQSDGSWQIAQQ